MTNVTFTNIKTNAISFGGFDDLDPANPGDQNFVISDISVTNCTFEAPDSLIQTKKYSYRGESQVIF